MTIPVLFIAYPKMFNCKAKFSRKVDNLTSNLELFEIAYITDEQDLVANYTCSNKKVSSIIKADDIEDIGSIDYAVVFSDHDSLEPLVTSLKSQGVKLRIVDTPITHVVNIDKADEYDEYIGRGSLWGNPFPLGISGDRDEVINTYAYHLSRGFLKFTYDDLVKLRGKTLGCHCKPAACHGDVLAKYLNEFDDGL